MGKIWDESKFGFVGMSLGSVALLLAIFHFWAGPFAPQPTIESTIAEKVVSIRDATRDTLNGIEPEKETFTAEWDADKTADVVASILGAVAIILGVIGYALNENKRVVSGAAVLGAGAIAFQFFAMALMMLMGILLIGVILSSLPIDLSP